MERVFINLVPGFAYNVFLFDVVAPYLYIYSFGQVAVIIHFLTLALLWITRDLGGNYGWSYLFEEKYASYILEKIILNLYAIIALSLMCKQLLHEI